MEEPKHVDSQQPKSERFWTLNPAAVKREDAGDRVFSSAVTSLFVGVGSVFGLSYIVTDPPLVVLAFAGVLGLFAGGVLGWRIPWLLHLWSGAGD